MLVTRSRAKKVTTPDVPRKKKGPARKKKVEEPVTLSHDASEEAATASPLRLDTEELTFEQHNIMILAIDKHRGREESTPNNRFVTNTSPCEAPVDSQTAMQAPCLSKENLPSSAGPSPAATNLPIQAIMMYPPSPAKGSVRITTGDYGRLAEGKFLNDVIIEFYLKYFVQTQLSPEDQDRTHVFSSFFYERLSREVPPQPDDERSPAQRRHSSVRRWTKDVDLFSKDFIFFPINADSHWFLAVVCFPGLTNAVPMSDADPPRRRVTPLPDEDDLHHDDLDEDDPNTSDSESCDKAEEGSELLDDVPEPIKQPCILIFDSLAGPSRSEVCTNLEEYIQEEYNAKHRNSKGERKILMRASVVKVPQQTNQTDCGLYLLQYVEEFFRNPITDYRMPIIQLVDWFDTTIISWKRHQIQQLLHKLMEEQNVDTSKLTLPCLNLQPEGTGTAVLEAKRKVSSLQDPTTPNRSDDGTKKVRSE